MRLLSSRHKSNNVAYMSLMTALAAVAGYLEQLIPISYFGIPGVKPGLANIVSLLVLYMFGPAYAFAVTVSRILLIGFMFGNMYSLLYSLAGGILSLTAMILLKKTGLFTMTGISSAGGIFHNIGQLIVAFVTLSGLDLKYYIPLLVISGTVFGVFTGLAGTLIYERLNTCVPINEGYVSLDKGGKEI